MPKEWSTILTSNRVNSVIENYATDDRVKTITDDPTACQYITKELVLENASTSIKILLSGHIHEDADIRAFYAVAIKKLDLNQSLLLSLDINNLNSRGQVINAAKQKSNGQSDAFVIPSSQYGFGDAVTFKDYTFTADKLPSFRYYRIKLLLVNFKSQVLCSEELKIYV